MFREIGDQLDHKVDLVKQVLKEHKEQWVYLVLMERPDYL